ncbi:rRNA maturation RNase YbeY [Spartinivicinus poritis]|uniref:Endoribonuclease YbeY n=1 Tax=Spartinivicinus poritis TaxID=2994640 RepID=A0ABT5U655_9GAMM|nr:rRNA maturation RNase YbeY [Spartinivicinus sp. A2-2]MDE1461846.1 rRNA maturation RNase YbeY [Spartinivicinus sp. A2-2]
MSVSVDIQIASECQGIPPSEQFTQWATAAVYGHKAIAELSIRVVDETESAELNFAYRQKHGPTNVLSFPAELPEAVELPLLGDLAICAPVVFREAAEQNKSLEAHWAHMVIHGTLHLLGFDHINDKDAEIMESLETKILMELDYPNPYQPSESL